MRAGVWHQMTDTLFEIRQTLRSIAKAPTFMLTAVAMLGLAIGVNAAIFTLVDTVLLDPLPYRDANRLVVLKGSAPGTDFPDQFNLAPEFLIEYQKQADLLESVASYRFNTYTLRTEERSERVWMSNPSLSLFDTLGVTPQLGRLPTLEEGSQTAVISHRIWHGLVRRRPERARPQLLDRRRDAHGGRRDAAGVRFPERGRDALVSERASARETAITPGQFGLPLVARVDRGSSHRRSSPSSI